MCISNGFKTIIIIYYDSNHAILHIQIGQKCLIMSNITINTYIGNKTFFVLFQYNFGKLII